MARKTGEELEKIKSKHGVDKLYSWSRVNSYHTSPYEYFLRYVKNPLEPEPEDREDCIYGVAGNLVHDIMERFYSNEITYEEMTDEFEDAWLTASVAELKFDRNAEDKDKKISAKYYECLKHFFKHHKIIEYKVDLERFITVKIGNSVLQGYIDCCFRDDDGCITILDWKTSTIYKGAKALNECGQLVVYAVALHQLGVPYEKIKICWDFLKYVNVEITQANGKKTERQIERNQIGEKLQSNAKMWLKKCGYEEEIVEYLDLLVQTNSIECLPKDVQAKYKQSDCIMYVDLTDELIDKWHNHVTEIIKEIEGKEEEYKKTEDDKLFWESDEQVAAQSYYFATLCGYSANKHKPYKAYLERLDREKEEKENLYGGVGTDSGTDGDDKNEDMSWLNDL